MKLTPGYMPNLALQRLLQTFWYQLAHTWEILEKTCLKEWNKCWTCCIKNMGATAMLKVLEPNSFAYCHFSFCFIKLKLDFYFHSRKFAFFCYIFAQTFLDSKNVWHYFKRWVNPSPRSQLPKIHYKNCVKFSSKFWALFDCILGYLSQTRKSKWTAAGP